MYLAIGYKFIIALQAKLPIHLLSLLLDVVLLYAEYVEIPTSMIIFYCDKLKENPKDLSVIDPNRGGVLYYLSINKTAQSICTLILMKVRIDRLQVLSYDLYNEDFVAFRL